MEFQNQIIHGAKSYRIASDLVELFVTGQAGHMGPVSFDCGNSKRVTPYSLSPWQPGDFSDEVPQLLKVLRGDFFCMPFGVSGLSPMPHGAAANDLWQVSELSSQSITMGLNPSDIGGTITKTISLKPGQRALYLEHVVSGLEGNFNFGHHPIIQFPADPKSCYINTSAIRFGQVYPGVFENPADGGYPCLKQGARFTSLSKVPMANGESTDLTRYPDREGFEDLIMVSNPELEMGWTAVTFPDYVWISLKNPKVLPSTLFWITNGGRHMAPWGGKHRCRMGLEDVCSYFHEGAESSRGDKLKSESIPTTAKFSATEPKSIRHIQLVHPVEKGFGKVESIERANNAIIVKNSGGSQVSIPVDVDFLF